MKPSTKILLFSAFIGTLFVTNKSIKSKYKQDDINLLLPAFRLKIQRLLNNMTQRGFDPILFDTGRTQKEADIFAAKGTGIVNSLHLLGAAADIISASKGWNWPLFFNALAEESKNLNLISGSTFKVRIDPITKKKKGPDMPHVQAIPVKLQATFRKLTSPEARNLFLVEYYSSIGNV